VSSAPHLDPAARARALLAEAYTELIGASKVAVGDDGKTLLGAAAAIDLAVELLTPPTPDAAFAANSCREALELANSTRAYASGGNIAKLLDGGRDKVAAALKLLS
jgi:hypothetical protein